MNVLNNCIIKKKRNLLMVVVVNEKLFLENEMWWNGMGIGYKEKDVYI